MDAAAWDERYAARRQWSVTPNQFVAESLADLPAGRALDLACGEGRNAIWLAGLGWRVTALDFAGVAVERGREAAHAAGVSLEWVVGDALVHELPQVDLTLLAYLQLVPHQRRVAVRRAWEALAPAGTFFLVAHDSSNLIEGTGGPQDPEVLYTADDVVGDLGPGCEVLRAERVARVVPAGDEHRGEPDAIAWDVLVHARKQEGELSRRA